MGLNRFATALVLFASASAVQAADFCVANPHKDEFIYRYDTYCSDRSIGNKGYYNSGAHTSLYTTDKITAKHKARIVDYLAGFGYKPIAEIDDYYTVLSNESESASQGTVTCLGAGDTVRCPKGTKLVSTVITGGAAPSADAILIENGFHKVGQIQAGWSVYRK